MHNTHKPQRVAKRIAAAGVCSRREAEQWITAGRVTVNGAAIDSPALNVTDTDTITVDGKPLPAAQTTRLFRFHKPAGCLTTSKDPQGRPTIYDHIPADLPRLVTVGRLDMSSEGLLLLTTDGELARHLERPQTGLTRVYRVRAHGKITQDRLDTLQKGVTISGIRYAPATATLDPQQGQNAHNTWITITLTEGKNREVRKLMESLGLQVNRLIRTSYGPFGLGPLPKGALIEVKGQDLRRKLPHYFGEAYKSGWAKPKASSTRGKPKPRRQSS